MRPLRVLFVNENIGGHASTHLHLRRALERRPDVQARFLDVPAPGRVRRLAGAPVPGLARLDLDLQPLRSQLALSAWTGRRLPALVRDADVVHVFSHNAALLSARTLWSVPLVVALDGTGKMNAYSLPYRRPTRFTAWSVAAARSFERRLHASADLIVATSDSAARSLREDYRVPADRVRVIHYGVGAPHFDPAAAPGTGAAVPRLVFVGTSLERKGGLQLLRLHQERFASRCELVLVTRDRVPAGRNVRAVRDLYPGDPRLWTILREGAAFVFPSEVDKQPNAVMEAMAAGLPVLAYPVNAVADMVENGVTGLLLADRSDAALAAGIEYLLADPARRARMGAAGRLRYHRQFSAELTVERLLPVLREAVARHGEVSSR
jgi:glycosyltransferase involved in cell wall biosynthesis